MWKHTVAAEGVGLLLFKKSQGAAAGRVEQGDLLVVSRLALRFLSVAHCGEVRSEIDCADFLLTHRGGDRELDDPTKRDRLPRVVIMKRDNVIEFVLHGPAVAFVAFVDGAEHAKCHECRPRNR